MPLQLLKLRLLDQVLLHQQVPLALVQQVGLGVPVLLHHLESAWVDLVQVAREEVLVLVAL